MPELPDSEPVARAQVSHFLSGCAFTRGDYAAGLRHLEQTIADFERAGDVRSACLERSNLAGVYIEGGMPEAAVRLCRDNLVACERARLGNARNLAQLMLGFGLTFFPERRGEAAACLAEATERSAAAQHVRHEGWARSARARLYYLEGRPAEAEVEALHDKIGERLKVLGEREQSLAEYETKARLAAYKVAQLQAEAAKVEPELNEMKSELGQVDVQLAERQRLIDESYGRVAKAKAALAEIRQIVSQ